jgi:cystathionine gamma-lyase
MTTVLLSFQAGDHFIVCDDVYGGTRRLFSKVLSKCGFEFTFVDMTKLENIEKAYTPKTKMVWIETPTNPTLKLIDIEAVSKWAKTKKLKTLVDNTFMSPYLQRPLDLGADITLHSTTKYLGGHSDVVGGFVGTSDEQLYQSIKFNQNSIGAIPGPMDCFLTLRGTKTLAVRMQRHSENARGLSEWLEKHSQVEKVIYPGLKAHPQHELAKKQMKDFGGMLTFIVKGGLEKSRQVLERTRIFACAESLGGVESLIEHPGIMTHASVPAEVRAHLGISDGLIRLSVGIEAFEDLKADLLQALK